MNSPIPVSRIIQFDWTETHIFAAANNLYVSSDQGSTWNRIQVPFTSPTFYGANIINFAATGYALFVSTQDSMYRSTDAGATLHPVTPGGAAAGLLLRDSDTLYIQRGATLHKSTDYGATWRSMNLPPVSGTDISIVRSARYFISANTDSIGRQSFDGAISMTALPGRNPHAYNYIFQSDTMFIAFQGGVYFMAQGDTSWQFFSDPPPVLPYTIHAFNGSMFSISTASGQLQTWQRESRTWVKLLNGTPFDIGLVPQFTILYINEQYIFYTDRKYGLYRVRHDGSSKALLSDGINDLDGFNFQSNNRDLYDLQDSLYRTSDHGTTWKSAGLALFKDQIRHYGVNNDAVFAWTFNDSFYVSSDAGTTWNLRAIPAAFGNRSTCTGVLVDDDNNCFISAFPGSGLTGGLIRSSDFGENWEALPVPGGVLYWLKEIGTVFYGAFSKSLFRSTDRGMTWDSLYTATNSYSVRDVAEYKNSIVVSVDEIILHSTNGGTSWELLPLPNTPMPFANFLSVENGLFLYNRRSIFVADTGFNWRNINDGISLFKDGALHRYGDYLIIGTDGYGAYRRLMKDVIVGVRPPPKPTDSFALLSSYPNPAASGTPVTLTYTLEHAAAVTLKVQDVLGRTVHEEALGSLPPGEHTRTLPTTALRPGMYFYTLLPGEGKRMVGKVVVN